MEGETFEVPKVQVQTVDLKEFFSQTAILQVEVHGWGAGAKIPPEMMSLLPASEEKTTGRKKLCQSEELDTVNRVCREISAFLTNEFSSPVRRLNKYFRAGFYAVKVDRATEVIERLAEFEVLLTDAVDALAAKMPELIERDALGKENGGLGMLFSLEDYPDPDRLRAKYWMSWRFMEFNTPTSLRSHMTKAMWARQQGELKQMVTEIAVGLREQAHEALTKTFLHLAECLTPGQDGKMKKFHETAITNVLSAVENIVQNQPGDAEDLREVARKIKALLGNGAPVTAERLKTDSELRAKILGAAEDVNAALAAIVTDRPVRKFTPDG